MKKLLILSAIGLFIAGCAPHYTDPKPPRATKGSEGAAIVVEEFADFQCPACGVAYPTVKALQQKFGDKILWKFYHFPLTAIHTYAFNAAMAAECAHDQGKFWEMHDMLYENQQKLSREDLYTYADKLNLNKELFNACFKSRAKAAYIKDDMKTGEEKGIDSTPSFVINGEKLDDWSQLETRLNALMAPGVPLKNNVAQ